MREEIIQDIYRAIRDAYNQDIKGIFREKNTVIFTRGDKKISVSFRIKIEDSECLQTIDTL
jgi:Zn/Cd-binding protein ZinT